MILTSHVWRRPSPRPKTLWANGAAGARAELPIEVLAPRDDWNGDTDLTSERGIQAILDVLSERVEEIEQASRER